MKDNVVPLRRKPAASGPREPAAPVILGKLARKDFELWVCLSPEGRISLKWWRWREDEERFQPVTDGALTLEPEELRPLVDLLGSVGSMLDRNRRR
jgi:hypothetical protein